MSVIHIHAQYKIQLCFQLCVCYLFIYSIYKKNSSVTEWLADNVQSQEADIWHVGSLGSAGE